MGRVAAPYGVRGWMKVQPFTSEPDALLAYSTWWLAERDGGDPLSYRVLEARRHSDFLVAKLEGIGSREEAATYRGREVFVPRDALPEVGEGEVYVSDLAGCAVVNRNGETLGTVADVQDNGVQSILRVRDSEGHERLIPFVAAYVLGVDLETNRIDVDWEADY